MLTSRLTQMILYLIVGVTATFVAVLFLFPRNAQRELANRAKEEVASQYSIYFLHHGALWKYGASGAQQITGEEGYTHLFRVFENGEVLLGTMQPSSQPEISVYPEHNTLVLRSLNIVEGRNRIVATFTDIADVVYQRTPGRFVLFGPLATSSNSTEEWKTEVTILNDKAEKVTSFFESNLFNTRGIDGGTTAFHELSDGTLLVLKKDFTRDTRRTYWNLTPSGERKVLQMSFPDDIDHLYWYNDDPIVQVPARRGRSPFIARLKQNGETKPLFTIPHLVAMNDLFDAFGATYLVSIIGADQEDWPPCSRLYRITKQRQEQVIGSVVGVWPISDGFMYAEPLETCTHVRLWKTNVGGRNATLIADDFTIGNYYGKPLVVSSDD